MKHKTRPRIYTSALQLQRSTGFVEAQPGVGDESLVVYSNSDSSLAHYSFPVSRQPADLGDVFRREAEAWTYQTAHISNYMEKFMHPSYQRIIGMGPPAVPLILKELEERPHHWFWALQAITGANPIGPSEAGNLKKMRDAWLTWAKRHRIQW